MVLLLFFCSGATALIYEVVWSKYLALMFGSTVQAQTVVLAVFMGGLALGNRLFGRRADALKQPLAAYGYVEMAIGLYAFFFSSIDAFADSFYVALGSKIFEQSLVLLAFKGLLSVLLLLGPTMLMGGTLPLIAAWLQKQNPEAGRWSARFYSVNSLGAVAGACLAGFFLVEWVGLVSTLQLTALINLLIGGAAVMVSRKLGDVQPIASTATLNHGNGTPAEAAASVRSTLFLAGALVTLTGAVSMGLEVLASRSLALIFGASLQAFAIVLMSFILGIGVGSALVASPRFRMVRRDLITVVLLILAAGFIGLFMVSIEDWVNVYRQLKTGLARTEMGYRFHLLTNTIISLVVLGLPAGLLGAVLPLWIREVSERTNGLGQQVGRLLTFNTLGAVGGVLFTGFVLMPHVGLRGSFGVLALVLCVAAGWVAWQQRAHRFVALASGVGVFLLLATVSGGEGWRQVLSSGVFRARETTVDPRLMELRKQHYKILFYEDAADATVSVDQGDGIGSSTNINLRINGKADASTGLDMATQYLLGHLPMLARPAAKDVFVLGFGSGVTGGAVTEHPIDSLTIAENCQPVLRASRFFATLNNGVMTNPKTHIWNEDARTVLKLSPKTYDVIISEPSNPWMAGVGSVFSSEFYQLAANRLKPGGVMAQWFHVYEMHDGILDLVLNTFTRVFPFVEIWDPGSGDLIILGSQQPWPSSPEIYGQVFAREHPRRDLAAIGLKTPEALWARQLASQRTAFAIPDNGALQSDAFPALEYEAPKAFYLGVDSRLLQRFDERTVQTALAAPDKRTRLQAISEAELRDIFDPYSSVNVELAQYFKQRFSPAGSSSAIYVEGHPLPLIFRPVNTLTNLARMPAGVSGELKALWEAEAQLIEQPAQSQAVVKRMNTLLTALATTSPPSSEEASGQRVHFLTVAVRACLAQGDFAQAKELLVLSAKTGDSRDLRYLKRIVERVELLKAGASR